MPKSWFSGKDNLIYINVQRIYPISVSCNEGWVGGVGECKKKTSMMFLREDTHARRENIDGVFFFRERPPLEPWGAWGALGRAGTR
jgi:hypothetical protein